MRNNTVYNSYYDYLNLATQPIFDHTKLNKLMNFKDIHDYFNILELYFKIKANIEIDNTNFQWDLKKNNYFDFKEFYDFYSNSINK